jgi:hypothetical protein
MKRVTAILMRPTTVLLLIAVIYSFAAAPAGMLLNTLVLTVFTALGAGELMSVLAQLVRRDSLRAMVPGMLLSAAGFLGSMSIHFGSSTGVSTMLFVAAMVLLIAGVTAVRRSWGGGTSA